MNEKILRRKILDWLNSIYPRKELRQFVISIMYQYYKPAEIIRELEYLTDAEYIFCESSPDPTDPTKEVFFYKLSPKGKLICENLKLDEAISTVSEAWI